MDDNGINNMIAIQNFFNAVSEGKIVDIEDLKILKEMDKQVLLEFISLFLSDRKLKQDLTLDERIDTVTSNLVNFHNIETVFIGEELLEDIEENYGYQKILVENICKK